MRIATVLVAALSLVASLTATDLASGAPGTWGPGIAATLPADAAPDPGVVLSEVSCASAGNCSAVGNYYDSSQRNRGLLLTQSAGQWAVGLKATPPANAAPGHQVFLSGVSCASPDDCAAIGSYDTGSHQQGLLLTRSGGKWSAGTLATMPGGPSNPDGFLTDVSCASAGDCTAVGFYHGDTGGQQGVLLTEAGGTWSAGVQAPLPPDAASPQTAKLTSVSCPSVGNCTAVGQYADSSGHYQGLLLNQSAGTWSTATRAAMPGGAAANRVDLTSVSCASPGDCSAVGAWDGFDNQNHAVLLSEAAGAWGAGVEATAPGEPAANPRFGIGPVSCGSAGNCTAVGAHFQFPYGFLLDQSSGTWATGMEPTPPANAAQGTMNLSSVSCPSAGNCTAVGAFTDTAKNSGQPLTLSKVSGKWTRAVEATLPAGAGLSGALNSVSCASAGNCTAVGIFTDSTPDVRGLLLTQSVPKASRASKVRGLLRRTPNVRSGSLSTEARRLDSRRLRTTFRVSVRVTHATTLRIDYSSCRATRHGPSCALEAANRSSRPFTVRPGLRHLTYRATVAYPRAGQRTSCVTAEVKDLNPRGPRQYLLGPVGARHARVCPR